MKSVGLDMKITYMKLQLVDKSVTGSGEVKTQTVFYKKYITVKSNAKCGIKSRKKNI